MMNKLVYNYLLGFLALLGAIPITKTCRATNYGSYQLWTVLAKLPPVNENISEEKVLNLLYDYTKLCHLFPDIIDVSPLSVKLYKNHYATRTETYISVSVFQ